MIPRISVEEIDSYRSPRWFALRVKSHCEWTVAAVIRQKGFEEFLPFYQCRHRWSDRVKSLELPLFPGYVFCRLDPTVRLTVLTIPGAIHFVGIGKIPASIEDAEIAALQNAVHSGLATEPWVYGDVGQLVRLHDGPLAGLEGLLVEVRDQYRVVVSVTLLKRSVAVEIDRRWVTPSSVQKRPFDIAMPSCKTP